MNPLLTSRLALREFTDQDLPWIHAYASDPFTTQYMSWGPNTLEETQNFLGHCLSSQRTEPRTDYEWAITLSSGESIGGCGIGITNISARQGYLGYILARQYWGQGYGTEAARAVVEFGFIHLRLHRIWADCDVDNRASVHILEKVGMSREGRLRHHRWKGGSWRDSFVYAILEEEWEAKSKGNVG